MRRIVGLAMAGLLAAACSNAGGGSASAPPGSSASAAAAASPAASVEPSERPLPTPTLIPGCLPDCVRPDLTRPGDLAAGDYETKFFFGSHLTVTAPAGWTSFEDSTGEFGLRPRDREDAKVLFWIDVYPIVDGTFRQVDGFDGTAKSMIDWIEANPNITVIDRSAGSIGGLDAMVLEFGRSPKAKNVDAGCPAEIRPCVNLLSFPQWDGVYGVAGPFHVRLVAADVQWGGKSHAFYAAIDADDDDAFAALEPAATTLIEGARLPDGVEQAG